MTACFLGIDVGSSSTKGVLLDFAGQVLAAASIRTKPRQKEGVEMLLGILREKFGQGGVSYCVGTGYGRGNVDLADRSITEISCHARGAHHCFPQARTVVDIGGQDSKVIRIGRNGRAEDFAMNEKCAAGTGRFLELTAKILRIPLDGLGDASLKAKSSCPIASTCAVFAESEIISKLSDGEAPEAIVKGAHASVISRLLEMGKRVGIEPPVALTGGVWQNQGIVRELAARLRLGDGGILVPEDPKIVGALGAALLAKEIWEESA